jgi:PhzF family phenazine biosynthesis protein
MKTYIVDSFTDRPFAGNPAGVCIPDTALDDDTMQNVAQEMGFSETAFIHQADGTQPYSIRFFSPVMEIPLCGHATLASAKVLFEETAVDTVIFLNINGLKLTANRAGSEIVMEFPVYETRPAKVPSSMLRALGLSSVKNSVYNEETNILLLEIEDTHVLSNLTPDFNALASSHDSINGVLITAPSDDDEYDFHSRYFWPWSGTNEDPVTGGTHTFLAKYWATRLGKTSMRSFQSSKRTGFMQVSLSEQKLFIKSQARIVLKGDLTI